jgi:hypothetical protein
MAATLTKLDQEKLLRKAQNLSRENRKFRDDINRITRSRDAYRNIVKGLCEIHGVKSHFDLFKLED